MAEEKNKKKLEDEIRQSEHKSPDDFDKNNETEGSDEMKKSEQKSPDDFEEEEEDDEKENLSGDQLKEAENMAPDDFDQKNEAEGDNLKEAEQKSPDDYKEDEENTSGKKSKKSKKSNKDNGSGKLKELEENYQSLNDKYLRLYSEFDNFRKRTLKEKAELSKTASQYVIEDLLPVLDDFERAIKINEESKEDQNTDEGFILIYNKLKNTLKSKGLEEMDSGGKEFNTDYHDAITQIPAPSKELKGKVVDVIEKGYLLNGKVIRYAKVVVGK